MPPEVRPGPTDYPGRLGADDATRRPRTAAALAPSEDERASHVARSQVPPRTVVVIVFTLLAIAAGLYLLWQLSEILQWLGIAIFLAVALAAPVDWLSRRRVPRALAILVVYA